MKKAITQLISIILVAVIAAGCGFAGACLALRLKESDTKVGQLLRTVIAEDKYQESASANASSSNSNVQTPVVPAAPITINVDDSITVAEAVAEKVLPSVVGVDTIWEETYNGSNAFGFGFGFGFGNGGGGGYTYENEGVGTGVIVDEAGYVLTNSHVINDGDYKTITVSLYDGQEVNGIVVWYEPTLDLAVVKIQADNLVAAELGDSDEVKIGSYAAAIGNPLGLDFERSMSQGIISGLNRTITVSDSSSSSTGTTMEGLMQTDATINSGNSGGPLLNSKGQVIAINSAKAGNGEGMGFAIPINEAKPIVEQIKATGSFTRPYIGISGMGLESSNYTEEQLVEMFGVSDGIYVSSVAKGGGAEVAGIKADDVIVAVNGTPVNTMNKLNSILVKFAPGDVVTLTVMRESEEMEFSVTLTDGNITF